MPSRRRRMPNSATKAVYYELRRDQGRPGGEWIQITDPDDPEATSWPTREEADEVKRRYDDENDVGVDWVYVVKVTVERQPGYGDAYT